MGEELVPGLDDDPAGPADTTLRQPRKGRAAISNVAGRYEIRRPVPTDESVEDPPAASVPTIVTPERTRTIITRNDSPDIPFDRSINPYRGCEHGCIYCFARPTHAYIGLSPGLDFETRIVSKPDAAERLEDELRRPGYRPEVLALGSNTDPYQPVERQLSITRSLLGVLASFDHPVSIVTKSDLITRDLDILADLARRRLVSVMISVTTLDRSLARRLEPRAPTPGRRLETIRALSEAGIPTGVLASPIIPGLNDVEIERILEASARAGARQAGYLLVRLPLEVKELFSEWLDEHYPMRAKRILALVRQCRDGRLNDPSFGSRMRGRGPLAAIIRQRLHVARRRHGLSDTPEPLDTSRFRVPPRVGDHPSLFSD